MLYPKIFNEKKSKKWIGVLLLLSILLSIVLCCINYLVHTRFHWSLLCVLGIIYIWAVTIYSMKKNVNIGYQVMVQMLLVSFLILGIDWVLGYKGWSVHIGLPIAQIVANFTMLILTITSRKKYFQYVIYQMMIFVFTILWIAFILLGWTYMSLLYLISLSISVITLLLSFILCRKEFMQEIRKRFHI